MDLKHHHYIILKYLQKVVTQKHTNVVFKMSGEFYYFRCHYMKKPELIISRGLSLRISGIAPPLISFTYTQTNILTIK